MDDFCREPDPPVGGATEAVGAQICCDRKELVHKVAVGAVDFHTVESGVDGIACRGSEIVYRLLDVCAGHRPRQDELLRPVEGEHRSRGRDSAGSDWDQAIRQQQWMPDAPGVQQLGEDATPVAWTASVTSRHALTCPAVCSPGVFG